MAMISATYGEVTTSPVFRNSKHCYYM